MKADADAPGAPRVEVRSGASGLVERAAAGDASAWQELIAAYGKRVFALAYSRCRRVDEAEEVTQSVFATLAATLTGTHAGEYAERGKFEAWLFRIAINRTRDAVRGVRRRQAAMDTLRAAGSGTHADPQPPADSRLPALRRALESLPDADRDVIELRHHAGLSFRQMSDLLDEPVGTLLARHHRALRKIRALMQSTADDGEQNP